MRTREQLRAIFAELAHQGKLKGRDVIGHISEHMPPMHELPARAGAYVFENLPVKIQKLAWRLRVHRNLGLEPLISSRRMLPLKEQLKAELRDYARRKTAAMPIKGEGSSISIFGISKAKPISVERFLEHMADEVATGAQMASNKLINLARSKAVQAAMPHLVGAKLPHHDLTLHSPLHGLSSDQKRRALGLTRGIFPPLEHAISRITIDRTARRFLKHHLLKNKLPQLIRHSRIYHDVRRAWLGL